jgi:DNA-directed RNA polymerase alpha subunit
MPILLNNREKQVLLDTFTAEECAWAIEVLHLRLELLLYKDKTSPIHTPIEGLKLSHRAYYSLYAARLRTIGDVLHYGLDRLGNLRGAGVKTAQEIKAAVEHQLNLAACTVNA